MHFTSSRCSLRSCFNCFIFIFFLIPIHSFAEAPATIVGAKTVGLSEALSLHKKGAVFIDVRDEKSWDYGHIEGAVHLDFNQDEFVILYVSDALDKETPVVFYCDSPLSATGAMASFFAASWGYKNVYFFRDGYYSWLASDLPMELFAHNNDKAGLVAEVQPANDFSVANNHSIDFTN
jgi:rhodanese-related sulfurtransferase